MKTKDNSKAGIGEVAFFASVFAKGENISLVEILEGIREGKRAAEIQQLRSAKSDPAEYDRLKPLLPAFMVSATTSGGHRITDVKQHTGYLQVDIDHVGEEEAIKPRDQIARDPHILAAWISPGGAGVKAIMRIPPDVDLHKTAFAAAAAYMQERYNVGIDRKCSDVSRLCFVSHDPGLVLNPGSVVLPVPSPSAPKEGEESTNSSESLHPESESASASTFYITLAFFADWPYLLPFFKRHVLHVYGKPQRGLRNSILVEIAASLFCKVRPDFIEGLALAYRVHHRDVFQDYSEDTARLEVQNLIEGCLQSYPGRLPVDAAKAYGSLTDESERSAFRICDGLSKFVSEDALPEAEFYLSCPQLALRLGVVDMQAHRILRKFEVLGFLVIVKKGTLRVKGKPGVATVFRWLLKPST